MNIREILEQEKNKHQKQATDTIKEIATCAENIGNFTEHYTKGIDDSFGYNVNIYNILYYSEILRQHMDAIEKLQEEEKKDVMF